MGDSDSPERARERIKISELVSAEDEAAEALDSLRSSHERPHFIQHVQAIPLVSSALEMYGRTRQSSAIVRAGGDAIESGVRRMCSPIAKRIGVEQLDDFACRQLSNLGYDAPGGNVRKRTQEQAAQGACEPEDASKERRGWGVGSLVATAKERALAYREDSMRRLKYCLDWVVYATALLRQHMHELRRVLAELQAAARVGLRGDGAEVAAHANGARGIGAAGAWVARARREIVGTVRRAVGVVSQYAGAVLPGDARRHVRALILGLPARWAAVEPASSAGSVSDGASPFASPRVRASAGPEHVEETARRTLALASESFHMLDSVRGVFGSLYGNAGRWIGGAEPEPEPP
ncbi:transcriptional regulator opi1, partial [Coemansia sp. RSA 2704]